MEVFKSFESFLKFEPFLFPSLLLSIRCSQYPFQRGARSKVTVWRSSDKEFHNM